ncbi:MAG: DUF3052 family protein [SAR202 cluster bacterium]|nr:DUF3052 family protein [SAR202 cluster bacterium]
MGQEAACTLTYKGKSSTGKALLESDRIIFRGDSRLSIPFAKITALEARDGRLRVVSSGDGEAVFELGAYAEKWERKIKNPPSLLDKLGVKPGITVTALGIKDEAFLRDLRSRAAKVGEKIGHGDADVIFIGVEDRAGLEAIERAKVGLKPAGGLWLVYPKGQRQITENDVLSAGRAAGLTDNKVASFSATHTALRFVIPRARR